MLAAAAVSLISADADACGGCFILSAPTESTVVNGHRMVLAVSPVQTVLWDQIRYSGDPSEFAWVLPIKAGAYIQVGTDAFFETLEAATGVRVTGPLVNCGSSQGCSMPMSGSDSEDGAFAGGRGGDPVQVVHEGTVGPYETVTLHTSTPGALNDWLDDNGYAVDDGTQPIIDAYVAEGFDFIALRLQPNAGVRQMKPVRVVTPGASPALPLRMVAAGTGAEVAIVLYVIGEGRWTTENFPASTLPVELLSWDFGASESNYSVLREEVLGRDGGRGWITTYARQGALFADINGPGSFANPAPLLDVYVTQALANGEITSSCVMQNFAQTTSEVLDGCPAGVPWNDSSCTTSVAGISARSLACGAADDLAVALIGMHPKDVWVTRLEANLPREALDADLELTAAAEQQAVDNFLTARVAIGAEDACPSGVVVPFDSSASRNGIVAAAAVLLALATSIARRRSRRQLDWA
jgi:hypothetical protein